MGGEVSRDFKSSNRIEISRLVQVLLNLEWFRKFPPWGVGGGWMGVGGGKRVHPSHMHMHTHAHMHMHTWTCTHVHAHAYDIIGNSQVFPQWGQPFAWNYHVYHMGVHACMCMRVRACMCTCVVHPPSPSTHTPQPPPTPIHPHPPPPELQGAQNTKIQ